ncbi:MAG: YcxB family protein [Lachnospiraceae bacterium]|nr:YcxB family protein [Lachnospiraceae bacterium]
MPIEFEVKLNQKDMYRFHMHHIYTSVNGFLSIVFAILAFAMAVNAYGKGLSNYVVVYILLGIVFLIYFPLNSKFKSSVQLAAPNGLKDGIRYQFTDEKIKVSVGEESIEFMWNQIYKMQSTKHQILIYTSRKHAYIITREAVGDQYEALYQMAGRCLEKYQNCMKA